MFNHESPLRGETFVTKKIVRSAVKYFSNKKEVLEIGNLNAVRDWTCKRLCKKYVVDVAKNKPQDYVISTGKSFTVREFIEKAYSILGIKIKWIGKRNKEIGKDKKNNKTIIRVNSKYFQT